MTGDGIASVVTSLATLAGVIGGIVVQLRAQTEARAGRADLRDKIDSNTALTQQTAAKVDTNTALTQATAVKVEEVHQATTAIVEATGTHQVLQDK